MTDLIKLELKSVTSDDKASLTSAIIAVPRAAVENSEFYAGLLADSQRIDSSDRLKLPFPPQYQPAASSYIAYLFSQCEMTAADVKSALELAHFLFDVNYLQYLAETIILADWAALSPVVAQLNHDLQMQLCLYLPYSVIPLADERGRAMAANFDFFRRWFDVFTDQSSKISITTYQPNHNYTYVLMSFSKGGDWKQAKTVESTGELAYTLIEKRDAVDFRRLSWDSAGVIDHEVFYLNDGVNTRDNVRHGTQRSWQPLSNGVVTVKVDKPAISLIRCRGRNGAELTAQLSCEIHLVKDKNVGPWTEWYLSGNKESETIYDQNNRFVSRHNYNDDADNSLVVEAEELPKIWNSSYYW